MKKIKIHFQIMSNHQSRFGAAAMEDKTNYNANASSEKIKDLQYIIDSQKQLIESLNKNMELLQDCMGK